MKTVTCHDCGGDGKLIAVGIRYAEGQSGPPCRELPCSRCHGSGRMPAEMVEWIAIGKLLREKRLALELDLRAAAEKWNMKPIRLSKLENGKIDNTDLEAEVLDMYSGKSNPIAPKGEVVSELEGTPIGFTVRKSEG